MLVDAPVVRLPNSIVEAGRALRDGSLTVEQLTEAYLACIHRLQPVLNAFITVTEEIALTQAHALDAELRDGRDRGPLHGIPIVYKDNVATCNVPTTAGSALLRNRVPTENAAIVRRLTHAGMVMLGKANQSELASGSSGVNVFFGNVHNPWDLDRAPGGSSSGTASAVAAGVSLTGIGTDDGGSIRQPASRCGIFGLRPTFGRVSLAGVWPRTRTLGAGGPMTRSVGDAAQIMNALVGYDTDYAASIEAPEEDFTRDLDRGIKGLRLGVIEDYTFSNIDPEIETVLRAAIDVLARLGAEIVPVRIPALTSGLSYEKLFGNVLLYEFHELMADQYYNVDEALFGPAVHSDIARGAAVSTEAYEAILRQRPAQTAEVRSAFRAVDALLAPVLPNVTPLQTEGPEVWARGRQFNLPFSFAGVPAASVPAGFARGMPVGLQLIGDVLQEAKLLRIAAAFEAATDHHTKRPPVFCDNR